MNDWDLLTLTQKLLVGLTCVIIVICLIVAVVFIQSTFKWGLWPSLAEAHDEFLGLPDTAETEQRLAAMDDCLVNAVAKQPLGRLRKLLLDDLTAACGYRITAAYLGLHAKDKYLAVAMDEITTGEAMNDFVLRLGAPIIARAQPR